MDSELSRIYPNTTSYTLSGPVDTAGGPLIVMARASMPEWFGTDDAPAPREAVFRFAGPHAAATDYDRACDVGGYLGVISVGDHSALVLGDQPVEMYVAAMSGTGDVLLVRFFYGGEGALGRSISHALGAASPPTIEGYRPCCTGEHVLFDSAYPGGAAEEVVAFDLPAPLYSVNTSNYHPNEDEFVVVHRFIPAPG